MAEVIMPKMGDAMTEGKVLRWMKHPGDTVAAGEAIAEIETDKVNVELPAEESGTLTEILAAEGATVPVGGAIAVILRRGKEGGGGGPPSARERGAPPRAPAPAVTPGPTPTSGAAPTPERIPPEERIKASPLARRLARGRGIDLAGVQGTGPEGRITKDDVEAFLARRAGTRAQTPTPASEDVPLTRMWQTIARRMAESKQQAPHFYVTVEILMDEALALRARLNGDLGEKGVSVNDLILKAAARALRTFPNLNGSFTGESLRRPGEMHMGFALALPEGLIVPVIRHCDRKSIPEIAREAKDLGERARTGRLHPDEFQGATFTVSNLGMFDVENFIAIIDPPQAAILAVGSAQPRAVVGGGAIRAATVMKATLSADHRVTDGAEAASYLAEVKRLLQNPALLLVEQQ